MKKESLEIRKVLERKDGIKMVIIPKNSEIRKGDYVGVFKINIKERVK